MGDRYGNKNGGIQAFLVEAVENGARIIDNCRVLRVLVSRKDQGTQRAIGLQCSKDNRQFEIIARKSVILAAGALQTPCILQRSNMRNKHIGRHLRLHPAVGCFGFMSPDTYIDGILGAPMTSVCNELARGPVDDGYGVKLECPVVYPGLTAAALPWNSPTTFLGRAKRYRNAVPIVVLQRDSGNGGSVCAASDDVGFHVYYTINEHDQTSLKVGLQGAARILAASGAIEISTAHVRDPGHRSDTQDPEELEKYIATIGKRNIKKHELSMFSAHQMGTCRMSNDPANGVVDSSGETWDCDDLYVMDTSLFPTASGSNPMVTAMTISYMLSTRLSLLLLLRDDVEGSSFKSPSDFTKAQEIATLRKETRSKRLHSHWMIHKLQVLLPFLVTMVSGWVLGKIHF
jgi:long-chain-alcohol oxidase